MNKQTEIEIVSKKFSLIKIAIDMHLRNYRVVRQIESSSPQPAQRFTPEAFHGWLEKQLGLGERVVVCYEAGCFGYEPARRMQAMGVEVYVIAPQNWDEQGKRQVNDKHDALVMCRRLSEYLAGHHKALSIVRIPSPEEEARRAQGRLREQLCRQIRRMQAMGRSLLLQRGMALRGRWWRGRTWEHILGVMPSWVIAQLEIWKELLELAEKQVRQIGFQPSYQGVLQWGALLHNRKTSAAARKKAIVALARRLAVDLWRMATGRVQAAQLGLLSKENLPMNPRKNLCR